MLMLVPVPVILAKCRERIPWAELNILIASSNGRRMWWESFPEPDNSKMKALFAAKFRPKIDQVIVVI